jgi:hypothetical protein
MPRLLKEKIKELEAANVPTASLLHGLAGAVAQYLANVTGGRVDIAMHGLVIISRMPAAASPQKIRNRP